MTLKVGAGGVVSRARAQYAPTLTAHDPNPPLPLETSAGGFSQPHGIGTETDAAIAVVRVKLRAMVASTETSVALNLTRTKIAVIGIGQESSSAFAITKIKIRAIGVATETNTALASLTVKLRAADVSAEVDAALSLAIVKVRVAGAADETDEAIARPRAVGVISIGVAVETDAAFALSRYPPRRPRASVVPAWASNGLKGSLPSGFWRRWL
jgi:hypothetical protein